VTAKVRKQAIQTTFFKGTLIGMSGISWVDYSIQIE
jgi:hypothetical protein